MPLVCQKNGHLMRTSHSHGILIRASQPVIVLIIMTHNFLDKSLCVNMNNRISTHLDVAIQRPFVSWLQEALLMTLSRPMMIINFFPLQIHPSWWVEKCLNGHSLSCLLDGSGNGTTSRSFQPEVCYSASAILTLNFLPFLANISFLFTLTSLVTFWLFKRIKNQTLLIGVIAHAKVHALPAP